MGLRAWPDEVRHAGAADARARLAPFAGPVSGAATAPHLALALALGPEPAPAAGPTAPGEVLLSCRIDGAALQAEVRCHDDDPWRRMTLPAAEIFAELLAELLADPARAAHDARGIGPASRGVVLGPLAGSAVDLGPFRAIPHAIEATTDRYPERPALSYGGRTLSYRAFDELANGLAAALAERGVGKGDVVPVVLVNGLEMPLAYQALMKLGAAFVPLRPGLAAGPHRGDAGGLGAQADRLHRAGRDPARAARARAARGARRAGPARRAAAGRARPGRRDLRHLHLGHHRQAQVRA